MLSSLPSRFFPAMKRITSAVYTRSDRFRYKAPKGFCQKAPEKPKIPLTARMRYVTEIAPKIRSENPNYSTKEALRVAQKMWKELDRTEKLPYKVAHKAENEQYLDALLLYECGLTDEQRTDNVLKVERRLQRNRRQKLTESLQQTGKPLPPCSAYMYFLSENSYECPNESRKERLSKLSTMWYNLTSEERERYVAKAREARKNFVEGTDEWGAKILKNFEKWDTIQKVAQEDKTIKTRSEPIRPPRAFLLFTNEVKATEGGKQVRIEKVKKLWDSLSQDEQKRYVDEAERLYREYVDEMNALEDEKKASFKKWAAEATLNRDP